jgi:hypothetical protein
MGWLLLTLVVAGMVGSQYVARSADTTENGDSIRPIYGGVGVVAFGGSSPYRKGSLV